MKSITLYGQLKIQDVTSEFAAAFPYLKLEFYVPGSGGTRVRGRKMLAENSSEEVEEVAIQPGWTISRLGKFFREHYNLEVMVYRRAGNSWVETSHTGSWTLEEQNHEGQFLARLGKTDNDLSQ